MNKVVTKICDACGKEIQPNEKYYHWGDRNYSVDYHASCIQQGNIDAVISAEVSKMDGILQDEKSWNNFLYYHLKFTYIKNKYEFMIKLVDIYDADGNVSIGYEGYILKNRSNVSNKHKVFTSINDVKNYITRMVTSDQHGVATDMKLS